MARPTALSVYGALWRVAMPWVRRRLDRRMRRDPAYVPHAQERFAKNLPSGPFDVWIHAVSVGETRAAEPIVRRLLRDDPQSKILLTHMTPTGRACGAELFRGRVTQCYLPYDSAANAQRFIEQVLPTRALIMETELWPNVIAQAAQRGVPVWLINARLSEKSARGYARWRSLSAYTLRNLSGVLAQSDADAARFRALGAPNVSVTGNIKFDCAIPDDLADKTAALRAALGEAPLWVFGSSREGEEAELLRALVSHPLRTQRRALIVPRHPQRFDEVFALAESFGFRVARRSDPRLAADAEVVIGDSMGEMLSYYEIADACLMGGSFGTGSQNLLEPCAVGTPVILGPSVFNFSAAAIAALGCGAAVQVQTAGAALEAISKICADAKTRLQMGAAGRQFFAENRGATQKTFAAMRR